MENGIYFDSLDGVSRRLGLPKRYLRTLADRGEIPSLRLPGGRRRFDAAAVAAAVRHLAARGLGGAG